MSAREQKQGYSRPLSRRVVEHRGVVGQMLGLHPHRPVPVEAQPGQILQDRGGEFRAAAGRIDVLQPQQEPPAGRPRAPPRDQRGERVAQVQ